MVIIIGLGNIGKEFENTYHNIGFMVVDKLAQKLSASFSVAKDKCMVAKTFYNGQSVLLSKPTTYMNNSGEAVALLKKRYRDGKIIVVCDDIDLPEGKLRFREKGSGGTHNGLRSIVSFVGEDFARLKVGIGRDKSMDLADFVLSKIKNKELFEKTIDEAADMLLGKIC